MRPRLLLIDNYDSFTYNLVQAFLQLGSEVRVERNDRIEVGEAIAFAPSHLVVSPGPGRPAGAGVSRDVIETFAGEIPVLGVCLGMQVIAESWGATVERSQRLMHGKTSAVDHDGGPIFRGVSNPFEAGRYHSLAVRESALPAALEVTARADDGEIMALRVAGANVVGVQFHPESILTPDGPRILRNFLESGEGAVG